MSSANKRSRNSTKVAPQRKDDEAWLFDGSSGSEIESGDEDASDLSDTETTPMSRGGADAAALTDIGGRLDDEDSDTDDDEQAASSTAVPSRDRAGSTASATSAEGDDDNVADNIADFEDESAPANLAELSDSSDEEEGPLLRIGDVPLEWYENFEHGGYDIDGKRVATRLSDQSKLSQFLDKDKKRTIYDPLNDKAIVLSKEELRMIHRIRHGKFPHASFNAFPEYGEPTGPTILTSIHNDQEPKRRFIPSKHERRTVIRMVNAIRNGWIVTDEERKKREDDKDLPYLLWGDDGKADIDTKNRRRPPPSIAPPKPELPGHAESYNPPPEYLPTEEEKEEWEDMDESDRPYNFTPQQFDSLRKVPAYPNFLRERYDRCLDLYLCPRVKRKRLNIDPESLIPKLPKPQDLRPFPSALAMEYKGHEDKVRSISVSPCGQWLASGSDDCTVRIFEVASSRCFTTLRFPAAVQQLAFNPNRQFPMLAVAVEDSLWFVHTGTGTPEQEAAVEAILSSDAQEENPDKVDKLNLDWAPEEETTEVRTSISRAASHSTSSSSSSSSSASHSRTRLALNIGRPVKSFGWHAKGDYLSTVSPENSSRAVLVHRLSTRQSQAPFGKAKGFIQHVLFHPSKNIFFVVSKRHIRSYNLEKQELVKRLQPPAQWISSVALHRSGDHLIVGSYDKKLSWFDMDLSSKPFRTLKYHSRAIRSVDFHASYPLFASASDDGSVHVFHSTVYSDLLKDPLIVPVKILKAHAVSAEGLGVLDCKFHPEQPWLFTSGSDNCVRMFQ